ncbi:adenosine kinase [Phocaeicola plebeius]|jgi:sugar/nucleoside kinase (ribokinase family)|uniref:Adenosine kinase n=1 Tax=Phocaeicola plebeius TaxID=310297 RepID=A0A854C4D0_9BACT|nr:adenosine kinase [Phocaeicola plebeius]MBS1436305.1 adenosine kinase [Bacteroides sp.]MBD9352044.1 adenosine kinase [Phocaeicola plebeius]MBD9354075.1 adenosine kinase [Phocaeicola plebeius]MCI6051122.1 adenosine kinase [Phocaeicola plebeius]MDD6914621.1 adenosine kinase [Phocaeicola plebeius]
MDKIIGMGNALVDVLVRIDDDSLLEKLHLPKGSMQLIQEDTLSEIRKYTSGMKIHRSTGGSAGNTVCALAALGANPGFIGKVGQDETGTFFGDTLRQRGVNALLATCDLPSGIASTFISTDGERTFGTYLGAAATLRAEDLSRKMFAGYNYLYIEGYLLQDHDLMLRAVQLAKEEGLQVCLDMASYNVVEAERDFFDQLIVKYVDIVFANESEALAYTGKAPHEALEEIASKCSIAVVKTGKEGSLVKKGTEVIQLLSCPVDNVLDTTGAGDFYAAGFMYGLTCGYSLEKCVQISTILATAVIQEVGTTLPAKKWDEIKLNIESLLQV